MVCPLCRSPAYVGATVIECANKKCFHHYRYAGISLERFGYVSELWRIHDAVEPEAATFIRLAIWKIAEG